MSESAEKQNLRIDLVASGDDRMTKPLADIRERIIEKAEQQFNMEDEYDPGIQRIALAAARETAILIRERSLACATACDKLADGLAKHPVLAAQDRICANVHRSFAGLIDDLLASLVSVETPPKECVHGHTQRTVGCVSCVLLFSTETP